MGAKRFDFCEDEHSREGWIEEAAQGQYVLASDYDALSAEYAEYRAMGEPELMAANDLIRKLEAALKLVACNCNGEAGCKSYELYYKLCPASETDGKS